MRLSQEREAVLKRRKEKTLTEQLTQEYERVYGRMADAKKSIGQFIDVRLSEDRNTATAVWRLNWSSTETTRAKDKIVSAAHFDEEGTFEVPLGNGDILRVKLPFASVRKPQDTDKPRSKSNSKYTPCTCGNRVPTTAEFCSKCGAQVHPKPAPCPSCGEPIEFGARFCPKCGTKVSTSPPEPPSPASEDAEPPTEPSAEEAILEDTTAEDTTSEGDAEWKVALEEWKNEAAAAKKRTGPSWAGKVKEGGKVTPLSIRLTRPIPEPLIALLKGEQDEDEEAKETVVFTLLAGTDAASFPGLMPAILQKLVAAQES